MIDLASLHYEQKQIFFIIVCFDIVLLLRLGWMLTDVGWSSQKINSHFADFGQFEIEASLDF